MLKRKGDISQIVTFLIIVFFLAVSFIVVGFANDELKKVIDETALNSTSVATSASNQLETISTTTINNGFGAIVAFLIIGMILSSMLVRVHPVFLFIYIIVLAISIFVAVPLANTYEQIITNDSFTSIASSQTIITWVMQNLILVLLGTVAISLIILFSRGRGTSFSGGGSDI